MLRRSSSLEGSDASHLLGKIPDPPLPYAVTVTAELVWTTLGLNTEAHWVKVPLLENFNHLSVSSFDD